MQLTEHQQLRVGSKEVLCEEVLPAPEMLQLWAVSKYTLQLLFLRVSMPRVVMVLDHLCLRTPPIDLQYELVGGKYCCVGACIFAFVEVYLDVVGQEKAGEGGDAIVAEVTTKDGAIGEDDDGWSSDVSMVPVCETKEMVVVDEYSQSMGPFILGGSLVAPIAEVKAFHTVIALLLNIISQWQFLTVATANRNIVAGICNVHGGVSSDQSV